MTDAQRAYLAGIFDGEGYIGSFRPAGKPPRLSLSIVQNDRQFLEELRAELGDVGAVRPQADAFRLVVGKATEIRQVLELIQPFARIKAAQIEAALEMTELMHPTGRKGLSETTRARREELHEQLRLLKRRGKEEI